MIQKPKIVFSHPTGNEFVRAAAKNMAEYGIIHEFNTALAIFPGELPYKLGHLSLFKDLRRRSYDPLLENITNRYPFYETGRLLAGKIGFNTLTDHEDGFFNVDKVYQHLDNKTANSLSQNVPNISGVYCYEDGAIKTFSKAKEISLDCFYDLPIGYWRAKKRLLLQAKDNRPEWAATIPALRDSEAKLARKNKELELADHIFVASSFTAKTLEDYPADLSPVHVIPYGFPEVTSGRKYHPLKNRKLKVLFVGSLTERKGMAELFEAVDALDDNVELTVVGKKPVDDCEVLNRNLSKHRYISSLPHAEVLDLMQEQDLFLFPSLFEGFGLVITEAMSQGTPVITTGRTAGPDLIAHGEDGWLIKAGSSEAIVEQVEGILQQPECLQRVGRAAMERAKKRPWEVYGRELAEKVIECSTSCSFFEQ